MARTGRFQHNENRKFKSDTLGENIAMKWTSQNDDFTGEHCGQSHQRSDIWPLHLFVGDGGGYIKVESILPNFRLYLLLTKEKYRKKLWLTIVLVPSWKMS